MGWPALVDLLEGVVDRLLVGNIARECVRLRYGIIRGDDVGRTREESGGATGVRAQSAASPNASCKAPPYVSAAAADFLGDVFDRLERSAENGDAVLARKLARQGRAQTGACSDDDCECRHAVYCMQRGL